MKQISALIITAVVATLIMVVLLQIAYAVQTVTSLQNDTMHVAFNK